ncbi:MAG TPA: hypothetical protein VGC51_01725 [Hansschlegelia sp.]
MAPRRPRICQAALCAVALSWQTVEHAHAGAFTLNPGEAKLFLSGLLSSGDKYYDGGGKLRSRGKYRKYDLQTFLEFGLADGVTLLASTGLQRIEARDGGTFKRSGLGRSEIGLRARLIESGDWIWSVQGSVVIAAAKWREGIAAIGETDDQFDVRGLVARTFEAFGKPAFLDLQLGYRARGQDPADEIRVDATFGLRPSPRWLLLAQSFNTIGTGRWRGPYPLEQRIFKLQGAALFDLTERVTLFGAAFFTPVGRDALDERGGTIGVGYRF